MPTRWEHVAQCVAQKRSLRWSTQKDFAEAIGVSVRVIEDLEQGRRTRFRATTLAPIENALGWELGAIDDYVEGRQPEITLAPLHPQMVRIQNAFDGLDEAGRRSLADIAEVLRRDRR